MHAAYKRKVRRHAPHQGRARRGRVPLEDGPIRHIEPSAPRRVHEHGFHDAAPRLGIERLVPIIDEDRRVPRRKHEMRRLRRIQDDIGGIHEEHGEPEPRLRQTPLGQMPRVNDHGATLLNDGQEFRILLLELNLANSTVALHGLLGMVLHPIDEVVGLIKRLLELALHREASDVMEKLAETTVLIGDVRPAVHAVNGVKPLGNLLVGVEVTPRLKRRAAVGANGVVLTHARAIALGLTPLSDGGRVVVNALNGANAVLHPLLAIHGGHGDIQQPHVRIRHQLGGGPGVGLGGSDGKHLNLAVLHQGTVGKVGGEPAVDTVTVIQNRGAHAG